MGKNPSATGTPVTDSEHPEQLQEEIDTTRQELGDTVAALSEKADVKAQAKRKLEDTKESVTDKKDEMVGKARQASPAAAVSAASNASQTARENPVPVALAGAFAAGFLAGRILRR
jgi:ElaB/YqjD/DUF883 family membrane-anchored ribosome-binding protein